MIVPKCNEIKLACIKCGCEIEAFKDYVDSSVNVGVWNNATVATIFSSIKSKFNGCGFVMAVCDDCLEESINLENTVKFHNHYKMEDKEQPKKEMQHIEMDFIIDDIE